MLDRLEELGGKVHRPYVASGVSQTADGAEITLDAATRSKAQHVVAADGMNSTIRDLAGLAYDGERSRHASRSIIACARPSCPGGRRSTAQRCWRPSEMKAIG